MTIDHSAFVQTICAEIASAVQSIGNATIEKALAEIDRAQRIYVFGEGRSGLALRMGAMRLVHLGKTVHIVGDATTPAVASGDLLIVGSGSGTTPVTVLIAGQARNAGARILTITAHSGSSLAELADVVLTLQTPAKGDRGEYGSIQPGGTLFEQSMLVLLDTLFMLMAGDSAADQIAQRHANLE
jgi:6-phospho-3-hexuloisomerase